MKTRPSIWHPQMNQSTTVWRGRSLDLHTHRSRFLSNQPWHEGSMEIPWNLSTLQRPHCDVTGIIRDRPCFSLFQVGWIRAISCSDVVSVKQCHKHHKPSPSHQHFYRCYGYHSQSWVVYVIAFATLYRNIRWLSICSWFSHRTWWFTIAVSWFTRGYDHWFLNSKWAQANLPIPPRSPVVTASVTAAIRRMLLAKANGAEWAEWKIIHRVTMDHRPIPYLVAHPTDRNWVTTLVISMG